MSEPLGMAQFNGVMKQSWAAGPCVCSGRQEKQVERHGEARREEGVNRRQRLERLLRILTEAIERVTPRVLAPLARLLFRLLDALEPTPSQGKESPLDELSRKRSTRRSQATG